ncbi:transmembrane protein, putative [Rhizoctonia solani AG-3 Rhs1AP]|uniref:Transmembrane protein, putative n=2 Tax=Rhizoctonia solani AG-3 TaxID=1086053 RepID=X8J4D0_9AGAM|nr:transmembrane protein, putative [Rhizoctonia solani AG-3 Rhs1AP]KEP46975.1 putative transmembrane protein [Rhizoctonia solani 123E]
MGTLQTRTRNGLAFPAQMPTIRERETRALSHPWSRLPSAQLPPPRPRRPYSFVRLRQGHRPFLGPSPLTSSRSYTTSRFFLFGFLCFFSLSLCLSLFHLVCGATCFRVLIICTVHSLPCYPYTLFRFVKTPMVSVAPSVFHYLSLSRSEDYVFV